MVGHAHNITGLGDARINSSLGIQWKNNIHFVDEAVEDFTLYEKCSDEQTQKYKGIVPDFLIDIWENYGLGTFKKGYIRTINTDDYVDLLNDTYFAAKRSIPIFTTAFEDILTYEKTSRCL